MVLEINVTNLNSGLSDKKIIINELELPVGEYDFNLCKHIRVLQNNLKMVRHSHYKNISGVSGSKRKIRPQKKMGRSRQGSIREIHMKGGSVKFGFSGDKEKDRHLRYRRRLYINKKERTLSQKYVLSNKINNNLITILDIQDANIIKTKEALAKLSSIIPSDNSISAMICNDNSSIMAIKNIKALAIYKIDSVNILNMLKHSKVIFTLESMIQLLHRLKIKYEIQPCQS